MIKGVIFDMDGVLFDTEKLMKEGWLKAAEELHFTITEEHFKHMRGSSRDRSFALFQEWFHGTVNYDEGRAIRSAYVDDYIKKYSVPEKKGLRELLSYLKEQKLSWAVATSTDRRRAQTYWDMAGITSFMAASVCGNEVARSKPEPDIFLSAAQKLGLSPSQCMVVEDSINGLKAAKAAGCVSCMVPDLTPYTCDLAPVCDHVCIDLEHCIPLLSSLNVQTNPTLKAGENRK